MNDYMKNISATMEKEDYSLFNSENKFYKKIFEEFSNADELIFQAKKYGYSLSNFLSGDQLPKDFPLPVRTSNHFYIKKHTNSQMGYYHSHDFYEMIIVLRGQCRQTIFNKGDFTIEEMKAILITPSTCHIMQKSSINDLIFKMVIPNQLFLEVNKTLNINNKSFNEILQISPKFLLLFLELLKESMENNSPIIISLLTLLFYEFFNQGKSVDNEYALKIREYLNNNLKTASLNNFAKENGYEVAYLSRTIKNKTGKSFSQFLNDQRMKKSIELLLYTDLTLEIISEELGYKSVSGFYRKFTEQFSLTPNQMRLAFSQMSKYAKK